MEALQAAGAAAVVVHGRTMEQRYKKPSDWNLVRAAVQDFAVPIVGNGDILTHYDVSPPSLPQPATQRIQLDKLYQIDLFFVSFGGVCDGGIFPRDTPKLAQAVLWLLSSLFLCLTLVSRSFPLFREELARLTHVMEYFFLPTPEFFSPPLGCHLSIACHLLRHLRPTTGLFLSFSLMSPLQKPRFRSAHRGRAPPKHHATV